jgi:hypothetical protein
MGLNIKDNGDKIGAIELIMVVILKNKIRTVNPPKQFF